MTDTYSPTLRRRRLSRGLLELREASGMTADEATRRLGWRSPSKLTRIERNDWRRPKVEDVLQLLDLYGVTEQETRDAFIALTKDAPQKGWWLQYKDVFRGSLPEFESEAAAIRTYEPLLVPGLLQTPEYAAAVWKASALPAPEPAIRRRVEARVLRQDVLRRADPPTFGAVVDEAALRKLIGGPGVMRRQIRHLVELAALPHVTIAVVADSAGAHAAMAASFMILDFQQDPSIVYMATPTDDLYLEKPEEVQRYRVVYDHVSAAALSVEASAAYLMEIHDQLPE